MSDGVATILHALTGLQEGQAALQGSLVALQEQQESLVARQERLEARVETLGVTIDAVRADFLAELGRTRADVMARMQDVRNDVTVNLAAAQLAERGARDAIDQGRTLADGLYALTRQVRQLQDAVNTLRNGGARPA